MTLADRSLLAKQPEQVVLLFARMLFGDINRMDALIQNWFNLSRADTAQLCMRNMVTLTRSFVARLVHTEGRVPMELREGRVVLLATCAGATGDARCAPCKEDVADPFTIHYSSMTRRELTTLGHIARHAARYYARCTEDSSGSGDGPVLSAPRCDPARLARAVQLDVVIARAVVLLVWDVVAAELVPGLARDGAHSILVAALRSAECALSSFRDARVAMAQRLVHRIFHCDNSAEMLLFYKNEYFHANARPPKQKKRPISPSTRADPAKRPPPA
jgi:hypothetical protein